VLHRRLYCGRVLLSECSSSFFFPPPLPLPSLRHDLVPPPPPLASLRVHDHLCAPALPAAPPHSAAPCVAADERAGRPSNSAFFVLGLASQWWFFLRTALFLAVNFWAAASRCGSYRRTLGWSSRKTKTRLTCSTPANVAGAPAPAGADFAPPVTNRDSRAQRGGPTSCEQLHSTAATITRSNEIVVVNDGLDRPGTLEVITAPHTPSSLSRGYRARLKDPAGGSTYLSSPRFDPRPWRVIETRNRGRGGAAMPVNAGVNMRAFTPGVCRGGCRLNLCSRGQSDCVIVSGVRSSRNPTWFAAVGQRFRRRQTALQNRRTVLFVERRSAKEPAGSVPRSSDQPGRAFMVTKDGLVADEGPSDLRALWHLSTKETFFVAAGGYRCGQQSAEVWSYRQTSTFFVPVPPLPARYRRQRKSYRITFVPEADLWSDGYRRQFGKLRNAKAQIRWQSPGRKINWADESRPDVPQGRGFPSRGWFAYPFTGSSRWLFFGGRWVGTAVISSSS